jgi:hypothetical protein
MDPNCPKITKFFYNILYVIIIIYSSIESSLKGRFWGGNCQNSAILQLYNTAWFVQHGKICVEYDTAYYTNTPYDTSLYICMPYVTAYLMYSLQKCRVCTVYVWFWPTLSIWPVSDQGVSAQLLVLHPFIWRQLSQWESTARLWLYGDWHYGCHPA